MKQMVSNIMPRIDKDPRRVPIIGYLVDTYSGHAALPTVAMQVNDMLERGATVSPEIVDSLIASATDNWLTQFRQAKWQAREQRQAKGRVGYTYFLQNGDRIKIGWSRDPKGRAHALSLRESNIIGVVQSEQRFERVCHEMWETVRIGNTEWFLATDELLGWIDGIAQRWHYKHRSRQAKTNMEENYQRLINAINRAT
jgi:hypothetical protein